MKKLLLIVLIFYLITPTLYAEEFLVPLNTTGNHCSLTISNSQQHVLDDVTATIKFASDWILPLSSTISVGSIPVNEYGVANFEFDALEVAVGTKGSVWFEIRDNKERILGHHAILVKAVPMNETIRPLSSQIEHIFPNPANPSTTIRYSIHTDASVEIDIFNILGEKVRSLFSGERAAGQWNIVWDGKNIDGSIVSSGIYFTRLTVYELESGNRHVFTKKLLIQK